MMKKKALLFTWNGFQDQEVVYPYYRLQGAGFEVTIVADKKDERGRIFGIMGVSMPCQMLWCEFYDNPFDYYLDTYDLLVIPGGVKALEKLRLEQPVLDFIRLWNAHDHVIASTCHGAQLLISAKIIKGRRISGYYSIQDDIENAGAEYTKQPVVVDSNIVSSPHYDFMGEWMEKVLRTYRDFNETGAEQRERMARDA